VETSPQEIVEALEAAPERFLEIANNLLVNENSSST
jgi:hypothetical protein